RRSVRHPAGAVTLQPVGAPGVDRSDLLRNGVKRGLAAVRAPRWRGATHESAVPECTQHRARHRWELGTGTHAIDAAVRRYPVSHAGRGDAGPGALAGTAAPGPGPALRPDSIANPRA